MLWSVCSFSPAAKCAHLCTSIWPLWALLTLSYFSVPQSSTRAWIFACKKGIGVESAISFGEPPWPPILCLWWPKQPVCGLWWPLLWTDTWQWSILCTWEFGKYHFMMVFLFKMPLGALPTELVPLCSSSSSLPSSSNCPPSSKSLWTNVANWQKPSSETTSST